jgi:hypothetical protein
VFVVNIEVEGLEEAEQLFDECDWFQRQDIESKLKAYIENISTILWGQVLSAKTITKMAEELSEAILEDIEVYDYVLNLWNENMNVDKCNPTYNSKENQIIDKIVNMIYSSEPDEKSDKNALAKYTMRYSRSNSKKFDDDIKADKKYLDKLVGKELYKKVYPVFWLEMLNRNRKGQTDDEECLVEPIRSGTEKEQYLFALLLNERTKNIDEHTIFSGVHRLYTERYKRAKKVVKKFDMQNEEGRYRFVRWMKNCLFAEKKKGNMNKKVFINNIIAVREMIEIGEKGAIDIPAFILLLDRLTGWIEFYNFILVGDGVADGFHSFVDDEKKAALQEQLKEVDETVDDILEVVAECTDTEELEELIYEAANFFAYRDDLENELTLNDDFKPDYADFEELEEFNHIAFLYAWGTNVRRNPKLNAEHHGLLGRLFIEYISKAYDRIILERKYMRNDDDLSFDWYESLYEELFVKKLSNIHEAKRIDALDFYDTYITHMKWDK